MHLNHWGFVKAKIRSIPCKENVMIRFHRAKMALLMTLVTLTFANPASYAASSRTCVGVFAFCLLSAGCDSPKGHSPQVAAESRPPLKESCEKLPTDASFAQLWN